MGENIQYMWARTWGNFVNCCSINLKCYMCSGNTKHQQVQETIKPHYINDPPPVRVCLVAASLSEATKGLEVVEVRSSTGVDNLQQEDWELIESQLLLESMPPK